jgi:hypothetical protein
MSYRLALPSTGRQFLKQIQLVVYQLIHEYPRQSNLPVQNRVVGRSKF